LSPPIQNRPSLIMKSDNSTSTVSYYGPFGYVVMWGLACVLDQQPVCIHRSVRGKSKQTLMWALPSSKDPSHLLLPGWFDLSCELFLESIFNKRLCKCRLMGWESQSERAVQSVRYTACGTERARKFSVRFF
jgi:hypothetical protein